MWKHIAANGLSLLIVACIGFAGVIGWGQREFRRDGPLEQAIFFEVPRGASLSSVSGSLAAQGAISNAMIFRLGAEYTGQAGELRFGTYEIPAGSGMDEVLEIVTAGGQSVFPYVATYVLRGQGNGVTRLRERVPGSDAVVELASFASDEEVPEAYSSLVEAGTSIIYRVSVPEGLTVWQVTQALQGAEFLTGEIASIPEEGTLAPDTYEVARGADINTLVQRMQDAQTGILLSAWSGRADGLPLDNPQEALVLASIIERETSLPEERLTVAGVFVNRLNRGMRLQTDPTVIYGASDGRGFLGRGLRLSELREDHAWNTYVIDGLPPTPIANPGQDSIEAAVNPGDTDFIFFVADGTGGHAFAETLEQHNRNVAEWRRLEAEREAASQ